MVNIYLTGKLGVLFGDKWRLDIKSPAEAIRAININTKGKLLEYMRGPGFKSSYKVALQKRNNLIAKEEIVNPSGNSDIYIIPTIQGSGGKNGAAYEILAAIVIIVVSYFTYGAGSSAAAGLFGMSASETAFVGYSIGASMLLGGITQLLTPTPNFNSSSATDQKQSNIIGNAGTISQGGSVPIVYGRALVAPMPISISTANYDQPGANADIGSVTVNELDGGGQQYSN